MSKSIAFRLLLIAVLPICMCCTAENKPGQRPKYWWKSTDTSFPRLNWRFRTGNHPWPDGSRRLADDGGMLFVFNSEATRSFDEECPFPFGHRLP